MAACGGDDTPSEPVQRSARITATPRSTALPEVAEAPSLGDASRPITIMFVQDGDSASRRVAGDLNDFLNEQLGLSFDVVIVEDESAALKALCTSTDGSPTAVWASAFTLVTAEAQCEATPTLAVTSGRAPRFEVGQTAVIVAHNDIESIGDLRGQTFCRLDSQDFTSWIFPSLVMASQNVDPLLDLRAVNDYPDNGAMLRAIYDGDCVAAALLPDDFEDELDDLADDVDEDPADVIQILQDAGDVILPPDVEDWNGYDTNVIPYNVLIFPPQTMIPAALRDDMTISLLDFFEDRSSGANRLDDLLGASGIVAVDETSFDAFRAMLTRAKWDMAFVE